MIPRGPAKNAGPFICMAMRYFFNNTAPCPASIAFLALCLAALPLFSSCSDALSTIVVKDHELRGAQWESMNRINEDFRKNVFSRCLAESKLAMNCSDCEYIYIDVIIVIDRKGHMSGYTKTAEKVCRGKAPARLERCFIEYLASITFPGNLRNMSIKMRLGTGLKC